MRKASVKKKNSIAKNLAQWYTETVFFIVPLIMTGNYAHITATKSWFYIGITAAVIIGLLCVFPDSRQYFKVNLPVVCAIVFIGLSIVSAFCSSYGTGCFTGSDGRSMGVIFFVAAAITLFVLTNVPVKNRILIKGSFVVELIIVVIAILNFLGIDFLGLVSVVPEYARGKYLSTIGYSNFLSEYISMITVMEIVFLTQTDEKKKSNTRTAAALRKYGMLSVLFLSYIGLLIADSSCGFLGVLFALNLFPFFFREKGWLLRSLRVVIPLPFSCVIGKLLYRDTVLDDTYVAIDTVVQFLLRWPVIISLFVIVAAILLLQQLTKKKKIKSPATFQIKWVRWYGILYIILLGLVTLAAILSNTGVMNTPLTITESFASNRGYIWKQAIRLYFDFPLKNKCFGIGPDELLPFLKATLGEEAMFQVTGQVFDSVHNFILHYLLTVGAFAVMALLTGVVIGIRKFLLEKKENSYIFLFPFLCYLLQALIIPSTPIVFPIALACFAISYQRCTAKD